jgi:translocation and assembly module TamB
MASTKRTGARRRWRLALLVFLLAGAGLIAALPWVLGWPMARGLLQARASAILAPGSVSFEAIRVSWFRPTELGGVVLRDAQGDNVLVAPRAVFQWNLWQILFSQPRSATLTFPRADLDIERLPDDTVDLHETLKPILSDKPRRRLVIRIEHGRLRFRDAALAEPVLSDDTEVLLDIKAHPEPIEWKIGLTRDQAERQPGRMELAGSLHPAEIDSSGRPGLTLSVKGSRWPLTLAAAGFRSRGDLDGMIDAHWRLGRLTATGALRLTNLEAAGEPLGSRPIPLDRVNAAWTLDGQDGAWTLQPFELTARLGQPASGGSAPPGKGQDGGLVGDLRLMVKARYESRPDQLEIREMALQVPYGQLDGTGTIAGLTAGPHVELAGSLRPDWETLNSLLVRQVEPKARIAGRSRGWRLAGPITGAAADRPSALRGELGVQLDALDLFGMRLGETAVVLRVEAGRPRFDPIDTTLNGGTLHLEPELVQDKDGPWWLKFGSSSTLHDAVVNDEVSHRVLSFVAPVLDGATRVQGRVSVGQLDAAFPILSSTAPARVEGEMLFDDVRFLPGPLAEELISVLPGERRPMLVLRDPVTVRVADRKVHQEGLIVPVGKVAAIGLEGSVDFDRNLDLLARFAMNPPRFDRPVLAPILRSARLEVPIRGTLQKPKIDAQAMSQRLKTIGSDLIEGSIMGGAAGLERLLERLSDRPLRDMFPRLRRPAQPPPPPRPGNPDPGAGNGPGSGDGSTGPTRREALKPPATVKPEEPAAGPSRPATPEERKARRQQRRQERLEKKAERRLKRGMPPDK